MCIRDRCRRVRAARTAGSRLHVRARLRGSRRPRLGAGLHGSCRDGTGVTHDAPTHRAIEAVWRIESAKVVAGVARLVRDVGLAEELAQDALVAALEHWPAEGVPDNPGAWLMTTAKHRALDRLRQDALHARK